uniref:Uncharacterized protein n=1 Tax=viral metagenome TaxID=1070528 RepID=A0A6H1ZA62_9ZZZZ
MSGDYNHRKKLTELYLDTLEIRNRGKDVSNEDFGKVVDRISAIVDEVNKYAPTLTLADHLKERQQKNNLRGDMFRAETLADLKKSKAFSLSELSIITDTSIQAVSTKCKRGEQKLFSVKFDVALGNSLEELRPTDVYVQTLQALAQYVATGVGKDVDKMRAMESLLKFLEPEVINELKMKYKTMNALVNFLLSELIPETNKRIRALLREMQEKMKNGEIISVEAFDLRAIFRELLPTSTELQTQLQKEEGLLSAVNA